MFIHTFCLYMDGVERVLNMMLTCYYYKYKRADLMYNARARRDNEHVLEGLGTPLEKLKPLPIPFHLHCLVPCQSLTATGQSAAYQNMSTH